MKKNKRAQWYARYYDSRDELIDSRYYKTKKKVKEALRRAEANVVRVDLYKNTAILKRVVPIIETEV